MSVKGNGRFPKIENLGKSPAVARVGGSPRGSAALSHSLSNGTEKSTYSHLHDTVNPFEMVNTLTKYYPKKVKIYEFKKMLKIRKSGFELGDKSRLKVHEDLTTDEKKEENRLRSIRRTRKVMNDIAECNDFDKFATFTFDPKKHDAYNADYCKKKMIQWLNNQQKRHGDFRYLMVSEPMKDGKTHFHALLGGFTGKYHTTNIRGKGDKARQCYKIDSWEKSNGFADMEDIEDKQRLVNYIVKYISKDISVVDEGKKRYWSSKNLAQPRTVYHEDLETISKKGLDLLKMTSYENDFCTITTVPLK